MNGEMQARFQTRLRAGHIQRGNNNQRRNGLDDTCQCSGGGGKFSSGPMHDAKAAIQANNEPISQQPCCIPASNPYGDNPDCNNWAPNSQVQMGQGQQPGVVNYEKHENSGDGKNAMNPQQNQGDYNQQNLGPNNQAQSLVKANPQQSVLVNPLQQQPQTVVNYQTINNPTSRYPGYHIQQQPGIIKSLQYPVFENQPQQQPIDNNYHQGMGGPVNQQGNNTKPNFGFTNQQQNNLQPQSNPVNYQEINNQQVPQIISVQKQQHVSRNPITGEYPQFLPVAKSHSQIFQNQPIAGIPNLNRASQENISKFPRQYKAMRPILNHTNHINYNNDNKIENQNVDISLNRSVQNQGELNTKSNLVTQQNSNIQHENQNQIQNVPQNNIYPNYPVQQNNVPNSIYENPNPNDQMSSPALPQDHMLPFQQPPIVMGSPQHQYSNVSPQEVYWPSPTWVPEGIRPNLPPLIQQQLNNGWNGWNNNMQGGYQGGRPMVPGNYMPQAAMMPPPNCYPPQSYMPQQKFNVQNQPPIPPQPYFPPPQMPQVQPQVQDYENMPQKKGDVELRRKCLEMAKEVRGNLKDKKKI